MKKILLLCMLFLSSFCFSTDGFKDIKWGSNLETIRKKYGYSFSDKKNDFGEEYYYSKIEFSNMKLEIITFYFENKKLTSWDAFGTEDKEQLEILKENLTKKYGEFEIKKEKDIPLLDKYDQEIFIKNFEDGGMIKLTSYSKKSNGNRRNYNLVYDSLTLTERENKIKALKDKKEQEKMEKEAKRDLMKDL